MMDLTYNRGGLLKLDPFPPIAHQNQFQVYWKLTYKRLNQKSFGKKLGEYLWDFGVKMAFLRKGINHLKY